MTLLGAGGGSYAQATVRTLAARLTHGVDGDSLVRARLAVRRDDERAAAVRRALGDDLVVPADDESAEGGVRDCPPVPDRRAASGSGRRRRSATRSPAPADTRGGRGAAVRRARSWCACPARRAPRTSPSTMPRERPPTTWRGRTTGTPREAHTGARADRAHVDDLERGPRERVHLAEGADHRDRARRPGRLRALLGERSALRERRGRRAHTQDQPNRRRPRCGSVTETIAASSEPVTARSAPTTVTTEPSSDTSNALPE